MFFPSDWFLLISKYTIIDGKVQRSEKKIVTVIVKKRYSIAMRTT